MLGDTVKDALEILGITDKRVSYWLGKQCSGCLNRQQKLNALHSWASRVVKGKVESALQYLNKILDE